MSDALSGTMGQDGGDLAGTPGAGTPDLTGANAGDPSVAELQAEVERLRRAHEQSLAEKTTLEATKRENEALKARLSAPPTGAGAGGPDPRLAQAAFLGRLQQHQAAAAADPGSDSALVVGLYEQNQYLARQLNNLGGLISVPADRQSQVRDLQNEYAQQRGEQISAATAQEILEGRRLREQAEKVAAASREQEAAEDARKRGVVGTRTVGVSRSEVEGKTMTMADFENKTSGMTPAQVRAFDRELATKGIIVSLD